MNEPERAFGVYVSWKCERLASADYVIFYTRSHDMSADIYTKGFENAQKWMDACLLIGVVDRHRLTELLRQFAEHEDEKEKEGMPPDSAQNSAEVTGSKNEVQNNFPTFAAPASRRGETTTTVTKPTKLTKHKVKTVEPRLARTSRSEDHEGYENDTRRHRWT